MLAADADATEFCAGRCGPCGIVVYAPDKAHVLARGFGRKVGRAPTAYVSLRKLGSAASV